MSVNASTQDKSAKSESSLGTLYVVATPIGNLSDVSVRMKETLAKVDVIVAEDTRHTKKLLQNIGISNRMLSYHKFNEAKQSEHIITQLQQGESVALVSDAGTPGISDPGSYLVSAAHDNGISVRVIPGPCAVSAALSVSGFDASHYSFHGFLAAKSSQRLKYLQTLVNRQDTLVFYESPKRIAAFINDLIAIFGEDRACCFCRELSKIFETVKIASLAEMKEFVASDSNQQKGEIVIMVRGLIEAKQENTEDSEEAEDPAKMEVATSLTLNQLTQTLSAHLSSKDILAITLALNPSIKKNAVYKTIIEICAKK